MTAALLWAFLTPNDPVSSGDLVTWQPGSVPIIISAPHGGGVRVPGSSDRKTGETVKDLNTAEVALLTSQRLTELCGGKPYLVIAQFSRKDVDANRKPDDAYENPAAQAQYEAYHRALRQAVEECRSKYGRALLLDLHGQAKEPDAIVRGTRNGNSLKSLIGAHGIESATGKSSVFGALKLKGYKIIPDPVDGELGAETFLNGGFITERYGSNNEDGVDTIQIEIGRQRIDATLKFSRDLASSIHACYQAYFAPKPARLNLW